MRKLVIGSIIGAVTSWFLRGIFDAWFFEKVVHYLEPRAVSVLEPFFEWGPFIVFAALTIYFSARSPRKSSVASSFSEAAAKLYPPDPWYRRLLKRFLGPQAIPQVEAPPEGSEFEKAFWRTRGSKGDINLLLSTLRGEGVQIRNHPSTVDHMFSRELDDWIEKINGWRKEAIDAMKLKDAADATWLTTLNKVPAPSIGIPNIRLDGKDDRARYIKAFCEHDFRLERFEKFCIKHGIGVV